MRSPPEKAEPRQPEEKSALHTRTHTRTHTHTFSLLSAILITIIAFRMINDSFVDASIGLWAARFEGDNDLRN